MPLYEYICQTCGARFEKLVRSSLNSEQLLCPSCASAEVKRALSLFATSGSSAAPAGSTCGPVG